MAKKKLSEKQQKILKENQFQKGKSGNPKGRPKKIVNQVLDDLKVQGAHEVTKVMINEVYQTMLSLTKDQVSKIVNDKSKPMLYRIIAEAMISKKSFEVIEQMIDRAQGKPTQTQNVNQVTELLGDGLNIVIPEPDEKIKQQFDKNSFLDD